MATYFDPATGQFERGTPSTSGLSDPQAQPAQPRENSRGGAQIDIRTDEQTGEQIMTRTPTRQGRWRDASEFARGGEIERTIRSGKSGNPVMNRAYNGNDTVEIGGQRMSLNIAAGLGLINRDANGGFSFNGEAGSDRAAAAQPHQPQGQQPQGQPDGNPEGEAQAETFRASDAAETAISALTQATLPGAQIAALNAIVETGEISEQVIERLVQNTGQEPAQIAQQVQQVYDGFHGAISSRLEGAGVHDLELFDEFVGSDQRLHGAMKKAVRDLMMHNDTSGFDRLATSYREALDQIDPEGVKEALDAAGIKHRRDGGSIVMNLPGHGEVSYRAIKAGLIKVSRG